jgi:hypothetical protein
LAGDFFVVVLRAVVFAATTLVFGAAFAAVVFDAGFFFVVAIDFLTI